MLLSNFIKHYTCNLLWWDNNTWIKYTISSQVKGLVLLSLLNISVVGSKVPCSINTITHKIFSSWYHINKIRTQINQLAVTAKTFPQPGIQLCVTSVAVQSWQTDFQGLQERLLWLVQHSCLIWTQIILVVHHRSDKHSSYITVHQTSHPASKCVSV